MLTRELDQDYVDDIERLIQRGSRDRGLSDAQIALLDHKEVGELDSS